MNRNSLPLGEICDLIKGTSPILKTSAGQYPLVTTGEDHRSASTFQFDTEAVCIPLVSSTGHGHASLKRVHYQKGRFALGNILVAAVAKKSSPVTMPFLERYLNYKKDDLIVPLMTGAANMSLSLSRLKTVPICFPSLTEQERLIRILNQADALRRLRATSDSHTSKLLPSLFNEMFGDPETNPKCWPTMRLDELAKTSSGGTPNRKNAEYYGGDIPWVKSGELNTSEIYHTEESITQLGLENSSAKILKPGTILLAMYGATVGKISRLGIHAATNQAVCAICPDNKVTHSYLVSTITHLTPLLLRQRVGGAQPNISQQIVRGLKIPIPPIALQKRFSTQVAEIHKLETAQASSNSNIERLFQSLQHRAFDGEI